jgi:hypothetical protein
MDAAGFFKKAPSKPGIGEEIALIFRFPHSCALMTAGRVGLPRLPQPTEKPRMRPQWRQMPPIAPPVLFVNRLGTCIA